MPEARTRCSPWQPWQLETTGSKPCTPAAWQRTHSIFACKAWMRCPREASICGHCRSCERWHAAHAPTSTRACGFEPSGLLPARKARSMASPSAGVAWWQRWQATLRWLPLVQSANSGLDRWHCAQRPGSVST